MTEEEKQIDNVLPARVTRFGNVAYLAQYLGVTTIARLSHDSRRGTWRALPTDRFWLGDTSGEGELDLLHVLEQPVLESTNRPRHTDNFSVTLCIRVCMYTSTLCVRVCYVYSYVCALVQFGAFLFMWASASLQFARRSAASFSALSRTLMRPNPVRKSPTAKSLTPGAGSCRAAQPPQRTSRSRLRPIAESIRHARRPARIAAQSATT